MQGQPIIPTKSVSGSTSAIANSFEENETNEEIPNFGHALAMFRNKCL